MSAARRARNCSGDITRCALHVLDDLASRLSTSGQISSARASAAHPSPRSSPANNVTRANKSSQYETCAMSRALAERSSVPPLCPLTTCKASRSASAAAASSSGMALKPARR